MNCTRCDQPLGKGSVRAEMHQGTSHVVWAFCQSCASGLFVWYAVRKSEFPPLTRCQLPMKHEGPCGPLDGRGGILMTCDGSYATAPQLRHLTEAAPELLHACRQAMDACAPYPQLLDLLRTAIKGALR